MSAPSFLVYDQTQTVTASKKDRMKTLKDCGYAYSSLFHTIQSEV